MPTVQIGSTKHDYSAEMGLSCLRLVDPGIRGLSLCQVGKRPGNAIMVMHDCRTGAMKKFVRHKGDTIVQRPPTFSQTHIFFVMVLKHRFDSRSTKFEGTSFFSRPFLR